MKVTRQTDGRSYKHFYLDDSPCLILTNTRPYNAVAGRILWIDRFGWIMLA